MNILMISETRTMDQEDWTWNSSSAPCESHVTQGRSLNPLSIYPSLSLWENNACIIGLL